jgi:hypothetical protein
VYRLIRNLKHIEKALPTKEFLEKILYSVVLDHPGEPDDNYFCDKPVNENYPFDKLDNDNCLYNKSENDN